MTLEELRAYYIPHKRDETLEDGEYYYLHSTMGGDKIIKVYPLTILPHKDGTEYGIYQKKGCNLVRIDAGYGDPNRGVRFSDLYDNKEDCKDRTHMMYEGWEELREGEE